MNIGIIQGRLSPPVEGKIQEFPAKTWKEEFLIKKELGLSHIEWIITKDSLENNPLFTEDLSDYPISSVCCDHIIDERIHKYSFLEENLEPICKKLEENEINFLGIPLLEQSNMEDDAKRKQFIKNINKIHRKHKHLDFIFETELSPEKTAEIVNSNEAFFVTYDTGNITSYLKKHDSFITLLKEKIVNVHIKDRTFEGVTKEFMTGDTDFKNIFNLLSLVKYNGLYTLQLARGVPGDEKEYIRKTLKKVKDAMNNLFSLENKTALITGGAGLLGPMHAEAIIEAGGRVILADIDKDLAIEKADYLNKKYNRAAAKARYVDVTDPESVSLLVKTIDHIDILINNAAKDPKVKKDGGLNLETRFENMSYEYWQDGLDAIINGTFLCTQAVINHMIASGNKGVILNIASDLSVIAPDQRIYKKEGLLENQQPVKPITYSAAKYAVVGMTKYLATYFAKDGIRVNCLSPTGVYNDHPEEFVTKLSNIIPMARMANKDEYKGAIVFMCSDASSYMTGHNLIIDGGKTLW